MTVCLLFSSVFSLYLSLPAMCIISNYNSHRFQPAMLKRSLQNKIKKRLVRCKGAHEKPKPSLKGEGKKKKEKKNKTQVLGVG